MAFRNVLFTSGASEPSGGNNPPASNPAATPTGTSAEHASNPPAPSARSSKTPRELEETIAQLEVQLQTRTGERDALAEKIRIVESTPRGKSLIAEITESLDW